MTIAVETRPAFHVTAPRNWINDPCAPIHWNGQYHLFYQHNPHSTVWGEMHWGHAVSRDLMNWTDLPIAMSPSAEGPDSGGCWSGCGRIVDGVPTIFYTGVQGEGTAHVESVCVATGTGDLTTLVRDARNPIVPAVTPELGLRNHRDPFILRDGDRWLMLLGTGLSVAEGAHGAGAVVLFESYDLETWTYSGIVFSQPGGDDALDTGPVWECPQLARFGDDWVLIVSVQLPAPARSYTAWFVGSFDGATFTPSSSGVLDDGDVYYAPALFDGPDGRTLIWGWLQETAAEAAAERGRVGAISLPRVLDLVDGRPAMRPAAEVEHGWSPGVAIGCVELTSTHRGERLGFVGPSYRLRFTVEADDAAGVRLLETDDGHEFTIVVERSESGARLVVTSPSSRSPLVAELPAAATAIKLDVFVDDTIVEIFAGDHATITTRMYPSDDDDRAVDLIAPRSARFTGVDLRAFG